MGLTNSTESKPTEQEKLNNIKKLFNNEDDTDNILESLNLTEFKPVANEQLNAKKNIPLAGGSNLFENNNQNLNNYNNSNSNSNPNKRYTKYDLFKILKDIDSEFQKGGEEDDNETSLDDAKSLEHIKEIILKELDNLKKNKAEQLGGTGCGCNDTKQQKFQMKNVEIETNIQNGGAIIIDNDSSSTSSNSSNSTSSELGKKKVKKTAPKKSKNTKSKNIKKSISEDEDDEDNSSRFFIETSESGINRLTSNGDVSENGKKKKKSTKSKVNKNNINYDDKKESHDDDESEGLSIFPFNSSDVKSSISVKNYRMLRRKI